MTTVYHEKTRCYLCGSENEFEKIGSTNSFGSPDLDTRPPEMQRSTIFAWVQRCPDCGYCASDVSRTCPKAQVVVNGKEYKDQLNNPTYPGIANSFMCEAIIERENKDFAAATWALINAAWICDDFGQTDQAVLCRQMAADMLIIAEENEQQVAEQEGASTAILVDLLRRSGRIEHAQRVISGRRCGINEEIIARILDFQTTLLNKEDVSCHTISEAIGEENSIV